MFSKSVRDHMENATKRNSGHNEGTGDHGIIPV